MTLSAARSHMILGQLYTNDIHDKRILTAMADVPREAFVPEGLRGAAYVDDDLDVGNGRALMSPMIFAKLLDVAEITPSCRVLVVGCLSGYAAAVIAHLAGQVIAVDTEVSEARAHMARLGLKNVTMQQVAQLQDGYASAAPYDVIVIPAAIGFVPDALANQLAGNGRLVAVRHEATPPGMKNGSGKGLLVTKIDGSLQYREYFDASATLLPGFSRDAHFAF